MPVFKATGLTHYEISPKNEVTITCADIFDGYHTMHELYQHRMALNVALFHALKRDYYVYKSKLHHNGTMFDGYFIVMAQTLAGQISYHYLLKHWDAFELTEVERAPEWDGHTPKDVVERLMRL